MLLSRTGVLREEDIMISIVATTKGYTGVPYLRRKENLRLMLFHIKFPRVKDYTAGIMWGLTDY